MNCKIEYQEGVDPLPVVTDFADYLVKQVLPLSVHEWVGEAMLISAELGSSPAQLDLRDVSKTYATDTKRVISPKRVPLGRPKPVPQEPIMALLRLRA